MGAVIRGDISQALSHYEHAISCSKKYGFIHEAAMACERAGILLNSNSSTTASQFLLKSYDYYNEWGANAKMRQLTERYPTIFANSNTSAPLEFAGEKESQTSISMMSQSQSSFYSSDEFSELKRKRT